MSFAAAETLKVGDWMPSTTTSRSLHQTKMYPWFERESQSLSCFISPVELALAKAGSTPFISARTIWGGCKYGLHAPSSSRPRQVKDSPRILVHSTTYHAEVIESIRPDRASVTLVHQITFHCTNKVGAFFFPMRGHFPMKARGQEDPRYLVENEQKDLI